jgi:tripartite-type tricarboxylate transporter receptor subunit TctC
MKQDLMPDPLLRAVAAIVAIAFAAPAAAQSYPNRPIKFVAPITAGSGTDVLGRALADKLSVALGQPVVIENRPGAGGAVGTTFVAKAPPDGYTILVTSSAFTAAPAIYANLTYDPIGEFAGVTPIADLGTAVVTSPAKGWRTVWDLAAYAKARPGQITYGSSGIGGASHMTTEKFRTAVGFQGVHVPYRGAPEAVTDVLTGRIDFTTSPLATALQLIQDGKLVALATPAKSRTSLLPDVPTMAEAGLPSASYESWVGVVAPKGTPREIVGKVNADVERVLSSADVKARGVTLGYRFIGGPPGKLSAFLKAEIARWAEVAKSAELGAH